MVYRCQDKRKGKLYACKVIDRRLIESKRNELLQQFQVQCEYYHHFFYNIEILSCADYHVTLLR